MYIERAITLKRYTSMEWVPVNSTGKVSDS